MVSCLLGIDEFSQIHTMDHFSALNALNEATKALLQEAASFDSFPSQKPLVPIHTCTVQALILVFV